MDWTEIIKAVDGPFGLAALFVLAVFGLFIFGAKQMSAMQQANLNAHRETVKDFKQSTDKMTDITSDMKVEMAKFSEKMDRNTDVLLGLHKIIDRSNK